MSLKSEQNRELKKRLPHIKSLAMVKMEKNFIALEKGYPRQPYNTLKQSKSFLVFRIEEELNELKAKVKTITDNLKTASKKGMAFVDLESGETFEPCPIKSGSKESLIIKIK